MAAWKAWQRVCSSNSHSRSSSAHGGPCTRSCPSAVAAAERTVASNVTHALGGEQRAPWKKDEEEKAMSAVASSTAASSSLIGSSDSSSIVDWVACLSVCAAFSVRVSRQQTATADAQPGAEVWRTPTPDHAPPKV